MKDVRRALLDADRIDSIESRAFREFIMQSVIGRQTSRTKLVCIFTENAMASGPRKSGGGCTEYRRYRVSDAKRSGCQRYRRGSLELVIAVAFRIDSIESRAFREFIMQSVIGRQTGY